MDAATTVAVQLAFRPDAGEQERFRQAIADALHRASDDLNVRFDIDPALIAGARLMVGSETVEWSLRQTLDSLSRTIPNDGRRVIPTAGEQ
jgi:F0F1-type ATP synthase delta subunit